jgi:hypothetical protein
LTEEASIQCAVDSLQVSGRWASLAGDLWQASYAAKKAIRDQLADLDRYPAGACPTEPMTRLAAGHSDWLQSWRTFVQVISIPAR